jgi:hypothetical protein
LSAVPYIIQLNQAGNPADGYIFSTQFAEKIPFEIKRVFWTKSLPETAVRGKHANKLTKEVLVAVSGRIKVKAETANGMFTFDLTTPNQGLYLPALCWTELIFSEHAIGLCLASTDFDNADYVRDYKEFTSIIKTK